jgi:hypothetical protein
MGETTIRQPQDRVYPRTNHTGPGRTSLDGLFVQILDAVD